MPPHKRILVIDDDPSICEIMQFALEAEGYTVSCSLGPDALVQMETWQPDLILLDWWLGHPGEDSRDLLRDLRATALSSRIPIILVSAAGHLEQIATQWSIDAILRKPFDLNELFALVAQWLDGSQMTAETSVNGSSATP